MRRAFPFPDYRHMTVNEADAALTALAADLLEELSAGRALELAAGLAPPRSPDWRTLGPRALGMSEAANPDYAAHGVTPDRPGRKSCAYCGRTGDLEPGPDKDWLGDKADHFCTDSRACIAARERRWPPRPDLVDSAMLSAVGADDARAAVAARQQADQQQAAPEPQQEYAVAPGWQYAGANGSIDANGTWRPPVLLPAPPARPAAFRHTLAHYYGFQATVHTLASHYGAASFVPPVSPDAAQDGSQSATDGPGQASPAPAADRAELERRGLYRAAMGTGDGGGVDLQAQGPQHPAATPVRPARRRSRSGLHGSVKWR